jgi:hypothetical protein
MVYRLFITGCEHVNPISNCHHFCMLPEDKHLEMQLCCREQTSPLCFDRLQAVGEKILRKI